MPKDPNAAAARWASRLSAAASDGTVVAGIDAVTVSPGQLAARAADLWATNTAAAKERFRANAGAVTTESWKASFKDKGVPRIAEGAQKSQAKMAAFLTKLMPVINNALGSLPPRGPFAQNLQRANAMATALHAAKGTFK